VKKEDLLKELRQLAYESGRFPKIVIDSLPDNSVIECYATCSCCGKQKVSDHGLVRAINACDNAEEFLKILHRDPGTLVVLAERWAKENYARLACDYSESQELIDKCRESLQALDEQERLYVFSCGSFHQVLEVTSEPRQLTLASEKLVTASYEGGMIFVGDFKDGVAFRPMLACLCAYDEE
jgi:hypothetical protein